MKRVNPEKSTDGRPGVGHETNALLRIADALEELRDIQLCRLGYDVWRESNFEDVRSRLNNFYRPNDG